LLSACTEQVGNAAAMVLNDFPILSNEGVKVFRNIPVEDRSGSI